MKKIESLIKTVLILLFLGCFLDSPYGYYQLVRFVGMVVFAVLAYKECHKNQFWFVTWCASVILINPFIKIALGRDIWLLVDGIWIGLLVISMFIPKRKLN